jgi:hypothetical protein
VDQAVAVAYLLQMQQYQAALLLLPVKVTQVEPDRLVQVMAQAVAVAVLVQPEQMV